MGRRWSNRVWRGSGALLILAALVVRLAAPEGWMLARGDGAPKLVLCTGHMLHAPAGHRDGHSGTGGDGRGDHPCVFAGAHSPPAPSLAAVAFAPTAAPTSALAPSPLADQRPGRGLAAPPPPSQGPPALA
jgi:hypothetical protein